MAKGSKRWLWFWGLLVVLAAVAIITPIVYNLGLQLKPEQVAQARAKWAAHGPKDYDLAYQERIDNAETGTGYFVKVRDGRPVEVVADGEPLPPSEWQQHTVDALLARIAETLERDQNAPGRRNYASAFFDKHNGYPIRYVHRVRGSKQRLEWNARLTPVTPGRG